MTSATVNVAPNATGGTERMTSPLGQDQDVSRSRPITTAEAAAIADMTIAAFRKAMQRLRLKGHGDYRLPETEWFPGSNPAWDERAIRKWAAGRLGRAEKKDTDQ